MPRPQTVLIPEKEIVKALDESGGNQRAASEKLRVSQAWLARWLEKNGYVREINWVKSTQPEAR